MSPSWSDVLFLFTERPTLVKKKKTFRNFSSVSSEPQRIFAEFLGRVRVDKAGRRLRHRSSLLHRATRLQFNVDPQTFFHLLKSSVWGASDRSSLLQDSVDAVARDTQDGVGGAAEVPGAAVPGLALQPLGGAVGGQAVQAVGRVQARQAPVGQPLVCGPKTGGRVSAKKKKKKKRRSTSERCGDPKKQEPHLLSRERCRLLW